MSSEATDFPELWELPPTRLVRLSPHTTLSRGDVVTFDRFEKQDGLWRLKVKEHPDLWFDAPNFAAADDRAQQPLSTNRLLKSQRIYALLSERDQLRTEIATLKAGLAAKEGEIEGLREERDALWRAVKIDLDADAAMRRAEAAEATVSRLPLSKPTPAFVRRHAEQGDPEAVGLWRKITEGE